MSDYKLVPVEPTAEMVEAAESAYMPFGDMEMAIRMALLAAPAVQGEPEQPPLQLPDFVTDPDDSEEVASLWDHGFKRGWNACLETVAKAPQPAEQQPAPDVAGLVEALEEARHHVVISPDPVRGGFIQEIDTALAAHRKQEPSHDQ